MLNIRIKSIVKYLEAVKAGKLPADQSVLRRLSSLVNLLPAIESSNFNNEFLSVSPAQLFDVSKVSLTHSRTLGIQRRLVGDVLGEHYQDLELDERNDRQVQHHLRSSHSSQRILLSTQCGHLVHSRSCVLSLKGDCVCKKLLKLQLVHDPRGWFNNYLHYSHLERTVELIRVLREQIWLERKHVIVFVVHGVRFLVGHDSCPVCRAQLLQQCSSACVRDWCVVQLFEQRVQSSVSTQTHESNGVCGLCKVLSAIVRW